MRKVTVMVFLLVVLAGGMSFAAPGNSPAPVNVIRVNLGGLLVGPWTGTYGLDLAYERIINDWLGWNFSTWILNNGPVWGVGLGTSIDVFLTGRAPTGVFINARTGVVSGEVYGIPVGTVQIGLSAGLQYVFDSGFVVRVGTGGTYVYNYRFVPRVMASIGFAF